MFPETSFSSDSILQNTPSPAKVVPSPDAPGQLWEYRDILGTLIFTDCPDTARTLLAAGNMVLLILTEENRSADLSGIPYCAQNPEELDAAYLHRVCQRFHHLPWQIAETARLRIREMTEADLAALYTLYEDAEAARFLDALSEDREAERQTLRAYLTSMYGFWGFGLWILEEKATGKVIGRAGFCLPEDREGPELGFLIHRDYRRQGYALEACRAILRCGREELGFTEIFAASHAQNTASQALLLKLGFLPNGTITLSAPAAEPSAKTHSSVLTLWRTGS